MLINVKKNANIQKTVVFLHHEKQRSFSVIKKDMKTKKEIRNNVETLRKPNYHQFGEYQIYIDGISYSNWFSNTPGAVCSSPSDNYDSPIKMYKNIAKTKKEFIDAIYHLRLKNKKDMKNINLVEDLGYEVEVRNTLVVLTKGTPENGETIELNNFNSKEKEGSASHYLNGRESICGWVIVGNNVIFIHREN